MKRTRPATRQSARTRAEYEQLAMLITKARTEMSKEKPTQARLAELISRDQTWVAKVETGARRVDVTELMAILDALEVDLFEFLKKFVSVGHERTGKNRQKNTKRVMRSKNRVISR